MPHVRRMLAAVFAGDRRVWRWAALASLVPLALGIYYCVKPRPYYTGTNSVEVYTYVAPAPPHARLCVPNLQIPTETHLLRMQLASSSALRPRLHVLLALPGRTVRSELAPAPAGPGNVSRVEFPVPAVAARPAAPATLCVSADGLVNWGGTPLTKPPIHPPTVGGVPQPAQVAIWYLPRPGSERSYIQRAGAVFDRAALFRPGIIGAWTFPVLLFVVLPALALLAVRTLALAVGGRTRRLGAWLFAIAALNACCWALITPPFQAPDEADHFAYVQSLVERGEGPSHSPSSPLQRWSGAENRALEDMDFFTDHQVGGTTVPWLRSVQREYETQIAALPPSGADGGGYTTSATHGPLYYLALAPAYAVTSSASIFSQLTLMRITSALLGALVALFAYLIVRELAPGRPWLAVLAGLLVAFQPMYGFISGIVNNDVGVNALAAALELLLIRILRRGITIPLGLLTGVVLLALPMTKGTGLSLYPVAALVFIAALWRYHTRRDLLAWGALALGALAMGLISANVLSTFHPSAVAGGAAGGGISGDSGAVSGALHNLTGFASYLWQVFLPRLGFMTPHFPSNVWYPAFEIFIERGWGAFGWYTIYFPQWVYWVIFIAILATFLLAAWAVRLEWGWVRRHWMELAALVLMPVAVILGFEAAYYTPGVRAVLAEFGRYAFPAIAPLAVLAVGALHAFGRRRMLLAGVVVLVAMIALSYSAQLLTLVSFYA